MLKSLKYPNLTIFFVIIIFTIILYQAGILNYWVESLERLGYVGIILVGMFFVSTFTVTPAGTMLVLMTEDFNILLISILAGFGGMLGDYFIFRFVKDGLVGELKMIFINVSGDGFKKIGEIMHTGYFAWLGPVIGALIIASPLPDEFGIGLLGIYKLDDKKFAIVTFILDTIGIFILLSAVKTIS